MALYENYNQNWSENSERLILTPSLFAKNNLFYPQEMGYFIALPGYFTERKGLYSNLLLLTLNGKGLLNYHDRNFDLEPYSYFWIDCTERHTYRSEKDWEFLWLHFSGNSSAGLYRLWESHGPVAENGEFLRAPLEELLSLNRTPHASQELKTSCIISNMLTDILLSFSAQNAAPESTPAYLLNILNYIDKHFNEDITLQKLEKEFGASVAHISVEFKRWFGINYRSYLINRRLNRAKELLRYSDLPIATIADEMGFPTPSYMIELFRKKEGITPFQYRKYWQK